MEEENKLIEIPTFNGDIEVKIESLGQITSNVEEVKKYAINLQKYYSTVIFDEDSMQIAKDTKSKINKFKTAISSYRKDIISEFNEPVKRFEELSKETETILTETYDSINNQVKNYEDKLKEEKKLELINYFEEYRKSLDIDFVSFENAKINVTLSTSMKKLKEECKEYLEKIADDIQLINSQEYKTEILVEYKQTLNVSKSIQAVLKRVEMIKREEEIKAKQEQEKKKIEENLSKFEEKSVENVVEAPIVESVEVKDEEKFEVKFKTFGTINQIKQLKESADEIGLKLENI